MAIRSAHEALKGDEEKRKLAESWLALAERYESFAGTYPASTRAPYALFHAADVYATLSRVSLSKKDLNHALDTYGKVVKQYPRSKLADDAALAMARIERDRTGDTDKAIESLKTAVAVKGDVSSTAKKELDALERIEAPARQCAIDDWSDEELPARPADPKRVKELARAVEGGDLSVSAQMGLKIRRIVLDPGHGGSDPGAVSPTKLLEKDINLAVAKELKTRLEKAGYEVFLTRETDVTIPLERRTRFANRLKADLFISLHCNKARNTKARGAETLTLNLASDRYAARLALRENATTEKSLNELQYLLADLATHAATDDSKRLAQAVQASLGGPRGVKQALFYVLLGARMPAVLVELGFLSNPAEEKLLKTPAFQAKLADSIAEGISRFAADRQDLLAQP